MRRSVRNGWVKMRGLMPIAGRTGETYWYLRRKGQPLVRMPDLPHDHPDFIAAYQAARSNDEPAALRLPLGSIAGLIEAAGRSDRFAARSAVYRATLRRHFDAIRSEVGNAPAKGLRDRHIKANLGKAKSPTDRLKAWRFLGAFGTDAGLLSADPSQGVAAPAKARSDGHPPWTLDEIDTYRARWKIGTSKRLAFELLLWGGMRIGDAVNIGPGMVDRSGVLVFRQSKTGDPAYVPWSCALPDYAAGMEADRDQLHAAIAAAPSRHMTFLATAGGAPRSSKALGTMIRTSARDAGIEKSAHGLRKSRAVLLADAGGTPHQIGAWTGHKSLKEIEHYTLGADRRRAVMGTGAEHSGAKHHAPKSKTGL